MSKSELLQAIESAGVIDWNKNNNGRHPAWKKAMEVHNSTKGNRRIHTGCSGCYKILLAWLRQS